VWRAWSGWRAAPRALSVASARAGRCAWYGNLTSRLCHSVAQRRPSRSPCQKCARDAASGCGLSLWYGSMRRRRKADMSRRKKTKARETAARDEQKRQEQKRREYERRSGRRETR
jgi:hypothetical protein